MVQVRYCLYKLELQVEATWAALAKLILMVTKGECFTVSLNKVLSKYTTLMVHLGTFPDCIGQGGMGYLTTLKVYLTEIDPA